MLTVALAVALVWANIDTHSYAAVWSHLVTSRSEPVPEHPAHGGRRDRQRADDGLLPGRRPRDRTGGGRRIAPGSTQRPPSDGRRARRDARRCTDLPHHAVLLHPRGGTPRVGASQWPPTWHSRWAPLPCSVAGCPNPCGSSSWPWPWPTTLPPSSSWLSWVRPKSIRCGSSARWLRSVPFGFSAVDTSSVVALRGGRRRRLVSLRASRGRAHLGRRLHRDPGAGGGRARAGHRLEQPVHLLSSYVVLPLFVLANAGVVLTGAGGTPRGESR